MVALLKFAADLPVAAEVQPEVAAIEQHRKLLANPDPVPGMVEKLTSALRTALNEAHAVCSTDHEDRHDGPGGHADLEADLPAAAVRHPRRQRHPGLADDRRGDDRGGPRHAPADEAERTGAIRDALPTRFSNALAAAAKLLEPKAQHVSLPGGTIKNDDDLKSWLKAAEERIRAKLKDGPVILVIDGRE